MIHKKLTQSSAAKIAGGESLTTRYEFNEFLKQGEPDIVQPDITRCGGMSEMRKIYDLAEMYGTKLVPHGFSTGILLAATVQFLGSAEHGELMEYSMSTSPLSNELVKNKIQFINGFVEVPDCIGLGIELNEDLIEKYKM